MKPAQTLPLTLLASQQLALASAGLLRRLQSSDPTEQRQLEARIIGGTEAPEDRFAWMVSLSDHIGPFCGGSLIAKDAILTAAHCAGGSYDIWVGRHDIGDNDGEVIPMKSEEPHPDYDSWTTDNDFMVVFLDAPVEGDYELVSLNSKSFVPALDQTVVAMGWGDTSASDDTTELTDVLMHTEVQVISNEECDASEGFIGGEPDNYHEQITSNMLCAESSRAQDACQGDSGGPLVIRGPNASRDVQVGVVSWGIGCAHDAFPGVYARVSEAYDWIQDVVCDGSDFAAEAGFDC
ncbi:hypothetical protein ACHAXT_011514 [Thalassiosira profunda]